MSPQAQDCSRALPAPVLVRAQRADNAGDNACRLQPALPALAPACPSQPKARRQGRVAHAPHYFAR